ncbi:MAG: DUF4157 domain-containing protein [Anaerolineae bacterium]|nr:DUF4157 domain-containing protein [Anaerolineae bacterium]
MAKIRTPKPASRPNTATTGMSHQPLIPRPDDALQQLLDLHTQAGNQAVSQFVSQGQLPVSQPGDPQEREADHLADTVLHGPEPERIQPPLARSDKAAPLPTSPLTGQGQPLPASDQAYFESRFGRDFSQVRLHTDDAAANESLNLNARAFTVGSDIAFAPGQYQPRSSQGRHLLAHELSHVSQQGAAPAHSAAAPAVTQTSAPQVQRGVFGDIWEGIKSAGQAIGGAISSAADWVGQKAKDVGNFLSGAAAWVGERLHDAAQWVVNLIRDLPARLSRLASTLWEGFSGVLTFIPEAIQALASGGLKGLADWLWEKAKKGGAWILTFVSRVFDVIGGPEAVEFIWHILTKARPLTGDEISAGSELLGPSAVRWGDVRVAEGGLLELIFALNNKRAYVMFHTINLPSGEGTDTVVHELTHVYQYEKAGSLYLGEAIHAQATRGSGAYNYGGPDGLVAAQAGGRPFSSFNREEQAQIAQDYYRYVLKGGMDLTDEQKAAYEHYIAELRAGKV